MKTNLFNVSEKIVVITGGAGVLGGKMATMLLENQAKVIILDLNQEAIEQ